MKKHSNYHLTCHADTTAIVALLCFLLVAGCAGQRRLVTTHVSGYDAIPASAVLERVSGLDLKSREGYLVQQVMAGNFPQFMRKMVKIKTEMILPGGRTVNAHYYVTPDYLSVGNNRDFFRIPLTPQAGETIARHFGCFLPTRKMVDDIYRAAHVKLTPQPLLEEREHARTFYRHHQLIEGQRAGRKGLIAGIKKDVVISEKVALDPRPDRVAIYGWHKPDGKPIQPLYTGHVDWYVDYSHGIRLVYEYMVVDGKQMHYTEVLRDPYLRQLLCDEEACTFTRYTNTKP